MSIAESTVEENGNLLTRELAMSVELRCPNCQSVLRIESENLGRRSRCPSCSHVFVANDKQGTQPAVQSDDSPNGFGDPLVQGSILGDDSNAKSAVDFESNPYSPISSERVSVTEQQEVSHTLVSVDLVFENTWAIFKQHWAMACVAVTIAYGVGYGADFVQGLLIELVQNVIDVEPNVFIALQLLIYVMSWSLGIWLQLGQSLVMLDICRGKPVDLSRIFAAGRSLVSGIASMVIVFCIFGLLAGVFVGGPYLIINNVLDVVPAFQLVALIGCALGLVPFTILSIRFSISQLLVADRCCGPWEAIVLSWKMTHGNKMTLFLMGLVLSAVTVIGFVVGLLALCIGVFPAIIGAGAFASLSLTVAYLLITGQDMVVPERNTVRS